ncbi:MAG: 1-acyl-sn-glycerol-3-phosphate acyltransferase [Deltaproteobacteria bacterium]|nr:1-acyl-sn-glycerol-3-phosphate acyltransferase [Deltaproteobacteria bacterium]
MLKTALVLILGVPYTIFLISVEIAVCKIRVSENFARKIAQTWARGILVLCGLSVRVVGAEHLFKREAYVFVANHASMLDIAILLGYLPSPFLWLAKKELFRLPMFGAGIRYIGSIPIDRGHPRAAIKSMRTAANRVKGGASIVVFPEGTRSRDGRMKPFKAGAFHLAKQSGRPMVPVALLGARRALPAESLRIRRVPLVLVITPPIPTAGVEIDKNELARMAFERIQRVQDECEPGFGKES